MEMRSQTSTLCRRLLIGPLAFVCLAVCQAASAQVLPPDTYRLSLYSQPGDPWSQTFGKNSWFYQAGDGDFSCQGYDWVSDGLLDHLTFTYRGYNGDFWQITFNTGAEMTPGTYENVGRSGLDVVGLGRGCLTGNGKFTILQVAYEGSGNFIRITHFAATFEFHCYGLQPALTGAALFNSNGFPPPPKLLMKERSPLPDTTFGATYSQQIEAEGGTPPYEWTVTTGELPPGLFINSNGEITGAPTVTGKYTFSIRLSDSAPFVNGYPIQLVDRDFSITVNPAGFSISDGLPPSATMDGGYAYQFTALGGTPPYQWSLKEGRLPPGLTLTNDGKLSGIPSSAGMFSFRLRVGDSAGHEMEQAYAIKVIDLPHIKTAAYKAKKGKLTITGEKFDLMATLQIDGQEARPKSHDSESFVVKALSLGRGNHELRVMNPDGGAAAVTITVE